MTAHAKIAEPTIVNGLNLDDLFELIDGVRRDASKAKTSWRVATTWQGQTRSRADSAWILMSLANLAARTCSPILRST